MKSVVVLQHAGSENLGTIEDALGAAGVPRRYVRSFEGEPVPRDVDDAAGLIVMGGPMGVYETARFPFLREEMELIRRFLEAERPILGVCLGSQLLAAALGATVRPGPHKEIGWYPVTLSLESRRDALWKDQPSRFVAYHWHGDVFDLPQGAVLLASSELSPVQSFRFGRRAYGLLFHLEVTKRHIEGMLDEFAAEVQEEGLSAAGILREGEPFLPPLQQVGATVFRRWIELA